MLDPSTYMASPGNNSRAFSPKSAGVKSRHKPLQGRQMLSWVRDAWRRDTWDHGGGRRCCPRCRRTNTGTPKRKTWTFRVSILMKRATACKHFLEEKRHPDVGRGKSPRCKLFDYRRIKASPVSSPTHPESVRFDLVMSFRGNARGAAHGPRCWNARGTARGPAEGLQTDTRVCRRGEVAATGLSTHVCVCLLPRQPGLPRGTPRAVLCPVRVLHLPVAVWTGHRRAMPAPHRCLQTTTGQSSSYRCI